MEFLESIDESKYASKRLRIISEVPMVMDDIVEMRCSLYNLLWEFRCALDKPIESRSVAEGIRDGPGLHLFDNNSVSSLPYHCAICKGSAATVTKAIGTLSRLDGMDGSGVNRLRTVLQTINGSVDGTLAVLRPYLNNDEKR